jgi:nucleotide-binding universal stress UspA family protein
MTIVVAALDSSHAAAAVLRTAAALAERLGATVTALHARVDHDTPASVERLASAAGVALEVVSGPAAAAITARVGEDTGAVVLGARGGRDGKLPAGSTAMAVATTCRRPVVVTPPAARVAHIDRVLVPLEGTGDAAALGPALAALVAGGARLVPLHVFMPATVPSFWDQPHHAAPAWSSGFLARFGPPEAGELWLRCGDIAAAVLDVVDEAAVDLVALTWTQDVSGAHAPVVRTLLARSPVPLLLQPLPEGGPTGE